MSSTWLHVVKKHNIQSKISADGFRFRPSMFNITFKSQGWNMWHATEAERSRVDCKTNFKLTIICFTFYNFLRHYFFSNSPGWDTRPAAEAEGGGVDSRAGAPPTDQGVGRLVFHRARERHNASADRGGHKTTGEGRHVIMMVDQA